MLLLTKFIWSFLINAADRGACAVRTTSVCSNVLACFTAAVCAFAQLLSVTLKSHRYLRTVTPFASSSAATKSLSALISSMMNFTSSSVAAVIL